MMTLDDFRALFRASPYSYLVLAPDLTIIGASGAYLRAVQRTEEDIVGHYVFDAFPENKDDPDSTDLSEVKDSLLRALAKCEPDTTAFVRYAIPVETAEGTKFETRYWSTVHTPVLDENGKPIFIIQNPVDVTELYRFDAASEVATLQLSAPSSSNAQNFGRAQMHDALSRILNNEREHLRSLFNQSPGFVAVLMGPKHVFEMVNESYYQLVGHRDLIGKTVWEALPEVAGQGYEELLDRIYTTGEPWAGRAMQFSVQRVRGGPIVERFVDLVYEPYRDRYGTTVGIFAQGYDVTDAVEAQASKRKSEERLRDGMEATKMVVWDWVFATDELVFSENVVQVLGCSPRTMASLEPCIHREDWQRIAQSNARGMRGVSTYQEVVRFQRPDNAKEIWVDSRGKVQFDDMGSPICMRGVTVDVTERYHAEFELRESNRNKDEFLAMLAHELRNPLAPISTAAEMLKLTAGDNPQTLKASEVISRQVKHMTSLVDDLLDVSRVTRGLVHLEEDYVDLKSAVASAVEQARPLIEARRHNLTVRTDAAYSTVKGDRNRLVQVIVNLLNNAAKYSPQGGEVGLAVEARASDILISVSDNGMGIDSKLLPYLFNLFTQGERTPDRSQGGLGIGLALVKTIVNLHGGNVTASSDGPGTGSKFTISLPAVTDPHGGLKVVSNAATGTKCRAVHVMIVDDNVDGAESLGVYLETQGHSVDVHCHPVSALSASKQRRADVFILDIGLPEIDGYELVRRLRKDPLLLGSTFIALTGYGQAHDKTLSKAAGFDHHFVKPMHSQNLADLLQIIRVA